MIKLSQHKFAASESFGSAEDSIRVKLNPKSSLARVTRDTRKERKNESAPYFAGPTLRSLLPHRTLHVT